MRRKRIIGERDRVVIFYLPLPTTHDGRRVIFHEDVFVPQWAASIL
jgi:hypothetical protein